MELRMLRLRSLSAKDVCRPALLALLVVIGLCSVIQAQQWKTYTTAEGLADNHVYALVESLDGAIWFGTLGGVSRYDGTWQTFTSADGLTDNDVYALLESSDGAIWLGTAGGGGVSRYQDGKWQTFTSADGLASNYVVVTNFVSRCF